MSVDQPVEHAATLEDVRAEVLTPDRLNALVFGGFAAVALAIAVIGVAACWCSRLAGGRASSESASRSAPSRGIF